MLRAAKEKKGDEERVADYKEWLGAMSCYVPTKAKRQVHRSFFSMTKMCVSRGGVRVRGRVCINVWEYNC